MPQLMELSRDGEIRIEAQIKAAGKKWEAPSNHQYRQQFDQFRSSLESMHGAQPGKQFTINPATQQRLLRDLQERNPILNQVRMVTVEADKGQRVYPGLAGVGTYRVPRGDRVARSLETLRKLEYSLDRRLYDFYILWETSERWRHIGPIEAIYRELYLEKMSREMAAILLRGKQRLQTSVTLEDVDYGIRELVRLDEDERVVDGWAVRFDSAGLLISQASVTLVGDVRKVPLGHGVAVADHGGGKVRFFVPNHGLHAGGYTQIRGTTNYNGEYLLDAASTANTLVLTHAYVAETPGGTAEAVQVPDFYTFDALTDAAVEFIPRVKRDGLRWWLNDKVVSGLNAKLYNDPAYQRPTERKLLMGYNTNFAGYDADQVLDMEDHEGIFHKPDNCSIYTLKDSVKRKFEEDHQLEGDVDWNRAIQGNVVEDPERIVVFRNIRFLRAYQEV